MVLGDHNVLFLFDSVRLDLVSIDQSIGCKEKAPRPQLSIYTVVVVWLKGGAAKSGGI